MKRKEGKTTNHAPRSRLCAALYALLFVSCVWGHSSVMMGLQPGAVKIMITKSFLNKSFCGGPGGGFLEKSPLVAEGRQEKKIWKNSPGKVEFQLTENEQWRFIFQRDTSSAITIAQILVKGGKRAVPASQRGLAFLTAGLSVDMPTSAKMRKLMHMGSSVFYQVEGDYLSIQIKSLSENFAETFKIVAKVLGAPLFSGIRIANSKRFMEHREKGEGDSPEQLMRRTCFDAFFGAGGIYAGSMYGNGDSRKNIKRKDVRRFYKRFFNRANMIVAVSSSLAKEEVTGIVRECSASLPPGGENPPGAEDKGVIPGKKRYVLEKDTQQVLIAFCALLPGMSRENYARLYILDNLLGKGAGSKLWPLRVKEGLAYHIHSHFTQFRHGGVLSLYLKTSVEKKEKAYTALKECIAGVYRGGITQQELAAAAVRSRADFLRENETKANRARNMADFEALGVGFDFAESLFSHLEQVTLTDFNGFLEQVLKPDRMIEVIIGPNPNPEGAKEKKKQIQHAVL